MGAREDAPLLRDPGFRVLVGVLVLLVGILFSHDQRITSDGIDHYVYLRSLALDHDLDLANDYAAVSPRGETETKRTPLGRVGNAHPIGPALVWSPFYLAADVLARVLGRPTDGMDRLYLDAVALASLLYGWLGLVLLYGTAGHEAGRGPALLATLGVAFGSFLYSYLAFAPTMAHAAAFGAASLFVWLWREPLPEGPRRGALLGAAGGLVALLRWADGLIALLWAVTLLPRLFEPSRWRRLGLEAVAFAATALVVFSPQLVVWRLLYGSFVTIPQGEAFIAGSPAWAGVLFSPRHGLFSWSPLLYVGGLGLLCWSRRFPLRLVASAVFFLALVRVNAGVADWWGGAAFGGRRFDAVLPLFGVGLALALRWLAENLRRRPLLAAGALVAAFVAWNVLIAEQYRRGGWDYAGPVAFEDMGRGAAAVVDRAMGSPFSLPASLFEWWRSGTAPSEWESRYMQRRHARWSMRMGLDERLFLEDGWSAPVSAAQLSFRRVEGGSAGLVVPLHGPRAYVLGLRARGAGRLRVLMNDRVLGAVELGAEWGDHEVAVPEDLPRTGRNFIRLRRPGDGPWDGEVEIAGAWLEPGR